MVTLYEDDGSSDTKPNVICYNSVLNACAFSAEKSQEERRQALKVAVETFNELRQGKFGLSPDAVSYGNMLKCCANLMPPGSHRTKMVRIAFMYIIYCQGSFYVSAPPHCNLIFWLNLMNQASQLFTSCCDEGLVGGMCLDEIRRGIPPTDFLKLLSKLGYSKPLNQGRKAHSVQLSHLPRKFTKNVKAGDLQNRQRDSFAQEKSMDKGRFTNNEQPVIIRRPGLLIEQSWVSGKDVWSCLQ